MIANDKALTSLEDIKSLGDIFVKSGFFADTRDASQAVVKILVGRELGLGPMASMIGVYIVKGRPALAANVMAAKVKASGKYDYRVHAQDGQVCEIDFLERDDSGWHNLGTSRFTLEDARKAGTQNLDKFPRNMLFARAMSNGVKWFCPDITQGLTVYEPTELGAEVDEDGKMISAKQVEQPPAAKPAIPTEQELTQRIEQEPTLPDPATAPTAHLPPSPIQPKSNGQTPRQQLKAMVDKWQTMITHAQTDDQIKKARQLTVVRISAAARDGSDAARHGVIRELFKGEHVKTGSVTELAPHELYGLRDWLQGEGAQAEVQKIANAVKQAQMA